MRIDTTVSKISFFQDLYEDARSQQDTIADDFARHRKQYKGDLEIDGSDEQAKTGRNITYEIIESQFSSYLPVTAVTPEVQSERNERNAKSVETLLRNKRNKLPFEKMNDIDERITPIYGGSVWLVEWDNSIKTHNTIGDVKITVLSPQHFVGQPYIYDIAEMEYCFVTFETTRDELVRRYGIDYVDADETESEEGNGDDTVTVVVCYYKNAEDKVCQYAWSADVELLDIEDYYSRKRKVCTKCGKREGLCECDKPKWETLNEEYEEIDYPIQLNDGTVINPMSPVIERGQLVMETVQQQAYLQDGAQAMDIVDGVALPVTVPVQVPKLERTKLPYYAPNKFPIVIRKNTSMEDSLFGQSDCEFIRPQQQAINKIESRILDKLIKGGVYAMVPEDFAGSLDNGILDFLIKVKREDIALYGRIDLECNVAQDIAEAERLYDQTKRIMGITDSFQGQADTTAKSGIAKQIQVAQSAGRLDSKRKMKNATYAEIDEIIFMYYLAYADEPRVSTYIDSEGNRQNAVFNRYDFIERDSYDGSYYYNYGYMFATDTVGDVENERATMWAENKANFQAGCYGNPQSIEALLTYWQMQERLHYPFAHDMVEKFRGMIRQQQAQMQAQLQAQQQAMAGGQVPPPQEVNNMSQTGGGYGEYLLRQMTGGNI